MAALFAASADARVVVSYGAALRPVGAIRIAWQGDPARGCEEAGMCSYSGSVTIAPRTPGELQVGPSPRSTPHAAYLPLPAAPVVRVVRTEAGQAAGSCIALLDMRLVDLLGGFGHGLELGVGSGLSTGRCAGPRLSGALARLPGARLPARPIEGRDLDLSGSLAFADGPFSGTVVSTLRARIGRVRRSRAFETGAERSRAASKRIVRLSATYRITRFAGQASAAFRGLPAPGCLPFDACATSGSASLAFDVRGRRMHVDASAIVPRSARDPRRALLRAFRAGRARVDGYSYEDVQTKPHAELRSELERDGGATCRDARRALIPLLLFSGRGPQVRVTLGGPRDGQGGEALDSRCPGPATSDVAGGGALARATLDPAALGRRSLRLRLVRDTSFAAQSYGGSLTSRFRLDLRRRSLDIRFAGARP
jgi:hypothetical protein